MLSREKKNSFQTLVGLCNKVMSDNKIMESVNTEEIKENNLEGRFIRSRSLWEYENLLQFNARLLKNQNILNFGCGGSHLGKELRKMKIPCNVVDVDLHVVREGKVSSVWLRLVESFIGAKLFKRESIVDNQDNRKLAVADGRNLILADGRQLPFKDRAFDTVLALSATYQVPEDSKKLVFRELMRVSNIIHCAPIFGNDFRILEFLAKEENFDIIVCRPMKTEPSPKPENFFASTIGDYQDYKRRFQAERRIEPPIEDSVNLDVLGVNGKDKRQNVNLIVLQRRPG